MFSRIRNALGLALALTLLTSITVFAKGGFAFIAVTGAGLKDEVRLTDPNLTADFFTFADFYQNATYAPANPGIGYEITRYYVDGKRETAFDKLHYYPGAGFVYYDGIVNGSSEYDGKWYTAVPDVKSALEDALHTQVRLMAMGDPELAGVIARERARISSEAQPIAAPVEPRPIIRAIVTSGLAIFVVFALWFRKPRLDKRLRGG